MQGVNDICPFKEVPNSQGRGKVQKLQISIASNCMLDRHVRLNRNQPREKEDRTTNGDRRMVGQQFFLSSIYDAIRWLTRRIPRHEASRRQTCVTTCVACRRSPGGGARIFCARYLVSSTDVSITLERQSSIESRKLDACCGGPLNLRGVHCTPRYCTEAAASRSF